MFRKWYKKAWNKLFGVGNWQGADHTWSPVLHTARVGQSDAFDEIEMHRAFDQIAEDLAREPDWLVVFKSKTEYMTFRLKEQERQEAWDHKYEQLCQDTAYTAQHAKQLKAVLAMA
jgi:hypothetical protein